MKFSYHKVFKTIFSIHYLTKKKLVEKAARHLKAVPKLEDDHVAFVVEVLVKTRHSALSVRNGFTGTNQPTGLVGNADTEL